MNERLKELWHTVADPGFPVGGGGADPLGGGRRPPTRVLFGKNVCENERIGIGAPLDPPMAYTGGSNTSVLICTLRYR